MSVSSTTKEYVESVIVKVRKHTFGIGNSNTYTFVLVIKLPASTLKPPTLEE
jgi:hypothetical protein